MLVQDPELVTSLEWRELPSSSKQSLLHQVFSDTVGSCSGVVYSMSPCLHVFGRTFQPRGAGAGYEGLCCTKSELRTLTRVLVSLVCGRSSSEAIEAAGGSLEQPAEHGGSSSLPAG